MSGAAGGAVHIGEGGRIEYIGAPQIELPPVDTGDEGEDVFEATVDAPAIAEGVSQGVQSFARNDAMGDPDRGGINDGGNQPIGEPESAVNSVPAMTVGGGDMGTDGTPISPIPGNITAGGTSSTESVSSENAENADASSPMVANEQTADVDIKDSEGMTPAPTSEEGDEAKSVRATDGQTPADGTLG